jgi:Bacterial mobilisation protein (MobC)
MDRKTYLKSYKAKYRAQVKSVTLSLDMPVYQRIEKAAAREGMKPTTFITDVALRNIAGQVYVPVELKAQLDRLEFLFRNVANNLNQIAHHTNTVRRAADERAVFAELTKLWHLVDDYTKQRLAERN